MTRAKNHSADSANHASFLIELLEQRRMLSAGTLRIASYNINADTSSFAGNDQRTAVEAVLEGMGTVNLNDNGVSNAQPLDLLALQELQNGSGGANAPTLTSTVAALNAHYGAGTYAFDPTTDPTNAGTTGNGPSGLIYNTTTVQILSAAPLGSTSGSGAPRAPMQYKIQPIGTSSANVFYLDVSHMKSGTDSIARRNVEAQTIVGNVPAGAHVVAVGDFNLTSGSGESTYQTLLGKFNDVALPSQSWNDSTVAQARAIAGYLSFSPTSARYRDDIQFVTPSADPSSASVTAGVQYISGSSVVFGNGGASTVEGNTITNSSANPGVFPDLTATQRSALLTAETQATDHMPVVADYKIVNSVPNPQIGTFTANPNSAPSGTNVTLSASGITDPSGTVTSVSFYRESNGTNSLEVGSDAFLGNGTLNGSTWSITVTTTGLNAGSSTFYAVAQDNHSLSSSAASTTVAITSVPSVGSLTLSPASVISGSTVNLTANSVTDAGSIANSVTFYLDNNGVAGLQTGAGGDLAVGSGTQSGGSSWTLSNISTSGQAAGTYTYYAVAGDATGARSTPSSAALSVTAGSPSIGTFSSAPSSVTAGGTFTLTADSVAEAGGTISAVNFYRESAGGAGLQIGSDTFVGTASQSGATWSLSGISTTGLTAGTYTYYAVAIDTTNFSSPASSTTLTLTPPPSPLVNIVILGSTNPNGPFSSNVQVSSGQTIYYEVLGQMAPVGTSNGTRTINSLTAHPTGTPTPTGYDGINSLAFNLSDSGQFSGTFNSSSLATNSATGDNWNSGTGASAGTLSGATLSGIRPIQASGVFAAALAAEPIVTGVFAVASTLVPGQVSTLSGSWSTTTLGAIEFNSNPSSGLSGTRLGITASDPNGYASFTPLTLTGSSDALPAWLASGSAATWNAAGKTLTVTGATTIIADPGTDLPKIVASGAAAQVTVQLPVGTFSNIHVGGIQLSSGAGIDVKSVSGRAHSKHNVLVIGALNASASPTISVDSASKINLEDNDLIVHTGTADSDGQTELGVVQGLAATGRHVAPGGFADGTWTGNGLTSSAAATADAGGFELNVLAVEDNSDRVLLGALSKWVVGTAQENLGANDILVKYTYNGDTALEGLVGDNSAGVVGAFYTPNTPGFNDYAFGDLNGDGKVDDQDAGILSALYGLGTGGDNGAQL